ASPTHPPILTGQSIGTSSGFPPRGPARSISNARFRPTTPRAGSSCSSRRPTSRPLPPTPLPPWINPTTSKATSPSQRPHLDGPPNTLEVPHPQALRSQPHLGATAPSPRPSPGPREFMPPQRGGNNAEGKPQVRLGHAPNSPAAC